MSGSNGLRLSEELREDSPAHALVNWQTKLRQAVLDAVTENDVVEIVKNQVKLAKEGDKAAIRFVMDYVVGARQNVTLVQQNIYGNDGVAIAAQAEKQGRKPKRTDRQLGFTERGPRDHGSDCSMNNDNDEPITGEWLERIGFLHESHDDRDYVIDCSWDETDEDGLDLRLWQRTGLNDGTWGSGLCSFGGHSRTVVYLPKSLRTRSDVRRLCDALAVWLKEESRQ